MRKNYLNRAHGAGSLVWINQCSSEELWAGRPLQALAARIFHPCCGRDDVNPWRRQAIIGSFSKIVSQTAASFLCLFFLPLLPAKETVKL